MKVFEPVPTSAVPPATRKRARTAGRKLQELWDSRELLWSFVVRDLKIRYKNSVLGFAWSLLTPLALMVVFTFIFTKVFVVGPRDFAILFLAGYLPWQYFANSVVNSVAVIVNNSDLIKKVYFPREFLPIATVLSQLVHLALSLAVLGVYLIFKGHNFLPYLPVLLLAMLLLTFFNMGVSMVFAAANVRFRDIQELTPVIFLLWFYGTPIFYSFEMVPAGYKTLLLLNPMTWYLDLFRRVLYFPRSPSASLVAVAFGLALVSFGLGYGVFLRLARTFAKDV